MNKDPICVALLQPTKSDLNKFQRKQFNIRPYHLEKYSNNQIVGALVLSKRFTLSTMSQQIHNLTPVDIKLIQSLIQKKSHYQAHFIKNQYWYKKPIETETNSQNHQNLQLDHPLLQHSVFKFIQRLTLEYEVRVIKMRIKASWINATKCTEKRFEYRPPLLHLSEGDTTTLRLALTKMNHQISAKRNITHKNQKQRQGQKRAARLYAIRTQLQQHITENTDKNVKYNPKRDLVVQNVIHYFHQYEVSEQQLFAAQRLKLNTYKLNKRRFNNIPLKTFDQLKSDVNRGKVMAQS